MSSAAGEYDLKLRWLTPTITKHATTGEDIEVHRPNGYLWCAVEGVAGRRQPDIGATQTGGDVTIRVRNYPPVDVKDLLEDMVQGYVYRLETIQSGDDELVIDGHYSDVLEDYTIDES